MDSGQLQAVGKYSSGVPFTGKISEIKTPEEQIQQILDAFLPVAQVIIDAIVPLIEPLWDEVLKSYPDNRVVWLAFHHPKAKVRKKNRHRIAKYIEKAVNRCDYD